MRTSATGRSEAGFTLLELLVVMVIVGIAVSSVVLALRPDPRQVVRSEGERMAALLDLASEESATGGVALGWVPQATGYEFQTREVTDSGPEWRAIRRDELLHPRQLPEGIRIHRVEADGRPVRLGERIDLSAQTLRVELASNEAAGRVDGAAGRFRAELVGEARP